MRRRSRTRICGALGGALLVLGLGGGAATASAAQPTPAAYLAEQLRHSPVHVSDQMPRTVPLSAKPAFVKEARRTGVPTYVLVLPGAPGADPEGLLAAVHDRLGRKGLYVLLDGGGGSPEAVAFGVDVPARDAAMATTFELPYDAGALESFRHFVDVLRSGDAASRADRGSEASRAGDEPAPLHTTRTDRDNQSFLTGLLLTGVPLLVLGVGWYVHRWRGGRGPGPRVLVPAAAVGALVIGAGAPLVYDDTRSDSDPLPTAADMRARTVRVAAGLRHDPVYVDPLARGLLTPAQLDDLRTRAARLDVPVRVAIVPLSPEDESAGDGELLAKLLHDRLGGAGDGVYVVAGASDDGDLDIVNHGGKVATDALHTGTEYLRYGEGEADDAGLYERLRMTLRAVDRAPSGPPSGPYLDPPAAEDPVAEDRLPGLYSGDFGPGATLGAFAALGVVGLTAAGLGVARRTGLAAGRARTAATGPGGRRTGAAGQRAADGAPTAAPHAPARPSTGWLRRTARRELDELNRDFDRLSETLTGRVRDRVWNFLDAATLVLDQEGDSRVDADADAPTLAAGLALVRAGRAALEDRARKVPAETRLCVLNPLHGPSAATRKLELPGDDVSARARPVCAGCRAELAAGDGRTELERAVHSARTVAARLLVLRPPGAGRTASRRPYDRVPGLLEAGAGRSASLTAEQIVRRVREQLGVH